VEVFPLMARPYRNVTSESGGSQQITVYSIIKMLKTH
jgi:hypothetical protein